MGFAQDVRFAVRLMARTPGFTLGVVLMLGLGIGANSAMFSLLRAVLLRPLPYGDPDRLVAVYEARRDQTGMPVSGHEFVAWRERSRVLDGITIWGREPRNFTGGGDPELIEAMVVSADFFTVLGLVPRLGRSFGPGDEGSPAAAVAVLSERLWRQRFGADPAVIGRTIVLDGSTYDVVGVMPARGDFDPDLWVPFDVAGAAQRVGLHSSFVVARLAPGISRDQAEADLNRIAEDLERELPGFNTDHRVRIVSMTDDALGSARLPLFVLSGAVLLILAIACVNVSHLVLTRAATRRAEIGIRAALGASRGRIAAQLVTESVLLALAGAALGLVLALWLVDLLPRVGAVRLPRMTEARIDLPVLGITAILAVLTGVLSGIIPALQSTGAGAPTIAVGMRATHATGRLGAAFMVSQVALTLMLLIGAGLLVRSFARLTAVDPGFEPHGALATSFVLPLAAFPTAHDQASAIARLTERAARLPGVIAAGTTSRLPLTFCCDVNPLTIENAPAPAPGQAPTAALSVVGGDWFAAIGTPILSGRAFSDADARVALPLLRYYEQQPYPPLFDAPQAEPVAVISATTAQRYWPGLDPVGRRFRVLFSPWITVVGVAGDIRQTGLADAHIPQIYLPASQEPRAEVQLVVRADHDPIALAPALRTEIRALDPTIPIETVAALDDIVHDSVGQPRFYAGLLSAFALLSLLLALVGIYGVVSYAVQLRTREIGIRWALGARPADVFHLFLGRTLALTTLGIAVGVAGALGLTRLLSALLFDTRPHDPPTFVAVASLLFAAALLAAWRPTARAVRADPLASLRGP